MRRNVQPLVLKVVPRTRLESPWHAFSCLSRSFRPFPSISCIYVVSTNLNLHSTPWFFFLIQRLGSSSQNLPCLLSTALARVTVTCAGRTLPDARAHNSNDCPDSSAQAMRPLILAGPPDVVASLMSQPLAQPRAQPNCIQARTQGSHSGILFFWLVKKSNNVKQHFTASHEFFFSPDRLAGIRLSLFLCFMR